MGFLNNFKNHENNQSKTKDGQLEIIKENSLWKITSEIYKTGLGSDQLGGLVNTYDVKDR